MSPLVVDDLVKDILTARVYDVAIESPLDKASKLSFTKGCSVYLKREDLQPVHSFKLRGAYNKMVRLSETEKARGVIAASAGNHAQGVALAAQKLGISALIVMPTTTPGIKVEAVKSYGAEVELSGDSYSDAAEYCKRRQKETGRTYIHPFDDPLVIAGQGTIGREILEQLPDVTHVFVCVGGGGLIAGVAAYIKALRPDVRVIAVEPEDSNAMQASVAANERIQLSHVGIFADGVAVKQVGDQTFAVTKANVDEYLTVSTDQICAAIKQVYEDTRSIVEPAGALGVAGIMQYNLPLDARAVAICSGANVTFERLQQIAERTLLGSSKEALLEVVMPEKPGALEQFCRTVLKGRGITQFAYRRQEKDTARVMIGLSVQDSTDKQQLLSQCTTAGYATTDYSTDDLAKEHIRHMVGGPSATAKNEAFYRIDFPEKPGALEQFLTEISSQWNISLFHYRSTASDVGHVFIGFETENKQKLEQYLDKTTYNYEDSSNNVSVTHFLKQHQ